MTKPRIFYNRSCDKCEKCCKEMVAVGCVVLCNECFTKEFKTDDLVKKERDKYKKVVNIMYKTTEKAIKKRDNQEKN